MKINFLSLLVRIRLYLLQIKGNRINYRGFIRPIENQTLFKHFIIYLSIFYQQVINGLKRIGHNITMSANARSTVQGILQLEEGKITANTDYRENGVPDGY